MRLDHLVRLISQQWAIHPEVLENWCQILDAKLNGHAIPAEFKAADKSTDSSRKDEPFTRDGNLAIVPLVGTLVKANSWFSCDATYAELRHAINAAASAKGIDATVIDGDTPGGSVAGVQETGDFIAKMSQRKPIYGWVDDLAASAGYWLLSQTRLIGAHQAADIGSIGVLTVHYDRSQRDQQSGVKRTVLAVGEMKAAGNDTAPLDDDSRQYIMERLQQTYALFRGAVTRGRPLLTDDKILAMQSRVYKAGEAKSSGLIDHVMGRDDYFAMIKKQTRGAVSVPISRQGASTMNLDTLKQDHPELVAQIETDARKGMVTQEDAAKAQAEAVTAARDGVVALHGVVFGEAAAKQFSAIVASGVTVDQAKALGITASTGGDSAKILAALHDVAPDPAKPAQAQTEKKTEARIDTASIYAARTAVKK